MGSENWSADGLIVFEPEKAERRLSDSDGSCFSPCALVHNANSFFSCSEKSTMASTLPIREPAVSTPNANVSISGTTRSTSAYYVLS